MLAAALQAEVSAYIEAHADQLDSDGHRLGVRNRSHRRCCVVRWWARLGAAVLSLNGEGEFGEGLRDLMPWTDLRAEFVMAAAEILDEGVSCADNSR
jgi:hypothetical protein